MVGDVTQAKLLQKALDTTAANSAITNGGATIKTTITSITIANTGATDRTVTMYTYGTATSNAFPIKVLAGKFVNLTGLDYVLSNAESFYFKQDTGTDVNIAVMGISEVIA